MGVDRFKVYYNRLIEVGEDWVKTGDWKEYSRSEIKTKPKNA